jgi:hypothetical protein
MSYDGVAAWAFVKWLEKNKPTQIHMLAEEYAARTRTDDLEVGPTEEQKTIIREAVTLFISTIIGMKPPHDRESFPPEIYASMDMLTEKIWKALR